MSLTKEELKNTPWFHNVDPAELTGFADWTEWLEALLHNNCYIWSEDGEEFIIEYKQLVDRVYGLKIIIFSDEHPPPHFHVKSPNVNASFIIENCEMLEGEISNRDYAKIKYWHRHFKPTLIQIWNESRPTDCTVGQYRGT